MSHDLTYLRVVDAYQAVTGVGDAALSVRMWSCAKSLPRFRAGTQDIGVRRWQRGLVWLSQHWPDGAVWPADVLRPAAAPARHLVIDGPAGDGATEPIAA